MRRTRAIRGAVVAGLLTVGSAAGACEPQIGRIIAPLNDPYEPFAPEISIYPLDIDVRNRSDAACDLRLIALSEVAGQRRLIGSSSRQPLGYELTSGSGTQLPNENEASFGLPVLIPANAERRVRLELRLNPGQVVRAGHYDDQLRLQLQSAGGATLTNVRRTPVSVRVPPRAQVNVAGTAGAFASGLRSSVLDLGDLSGGSRGRVYLQVRSNEAVRIRLVSQNRGVLRHTTIADQTIPYQFSVDGSAVDLRGPTRLVRSPPRTLDGAAYLGVATVAPVSNRFAGEYRDVITITVDADS